MVSSRHRRVMVDANSLQCQVALKAVEPTVAIASPRGSWRPSTGTTSNDCKNVTRDGFRASGLQTGTTSNRCRRNAGGYLTLAHCSVRKTGLPEGCSPETGGGRGHSAATAIAVDPAGSHDSLVDTRAPTHTAT